MTEENNVKDAPKPEAVSAGAPPESDAERASRLESELAALKADVEKERAQNSRMLAEYAEFSELFPDVSPDKIDDLVWESVKNGVPLAAAYALYDKKRSAEKRSAEAVNEKNSASAAGSVKGAGGDEYFSPAEVRAMSRGEVRANFDKIMSSMKKWK